MNDQFPPPGWFMRPETWPYWMPNSLVGARTPPAPPRGTWDASWPGISRGGILGNLTRPAEDMWANPSEGIAWPPAAPTNPPAFWPTLPEASPNQNSTFSWDTSPAAGSGFPGTAPEERSVTTPTVPQESSTKPSPPFYGPGDVLLPRPEPAPPPPPPPPPRDFRTWLHDTLSDKNVRYYAGPHLYEALLKLRALTQLLPGSGTVQSTQDASRASEEAKAGNYGKAAAHLGLGTVNAALDWLPPAKLAIIGGTMARTFPWNKLPTAMKMEAAGKSADEIWRATGLERAADERWTFEIPDKGYQVNPNVGKRIGPGSITVAPLYEHHAHPGMQEAYPGLSTWQSRLRVDPVVETYGATNVGRKQLMVRAPNLESARSAGIHELKHSIDWFEKHPPGGSPHQFMERGLPEQEAYDLYNRLVGEVAARNAQKRLDWGDIIRSYRRPAATEDVPRHRQINLYDE
jgi:conjugative element/phage-associated large polyvalent protein